MPPGESIQLTDLPLVVLVRVAAIVSEGSVCHITSSPLQVACDALDWFKLRPTRSTCRLLREAADLSISGVSLECRLREDLQEEDAQNMAREDSKTRFQRRMSFALKTALSRRACENFAQASRSAVAQHAQRFFLARP